jgi:hypothetical protein
LFGEIESEREGRVAAIPADDPDDARNGGAPSGARLGAPLAGSSSPLFRLLALGCRERRTAIICTVCCGGLLLLCCVCEGG